MEKNKNKVAFFNILSTVLLKGLNVITAPLFSQMLGVENYGVVSTYSTWEALIAIVFTLSVSATIANSRVFFPESQWDAYQSSILSLACTSFAVFSAITLLFSEQIAGLIRLDQRLIPLMLIQAFGSCSLGFVTSRFGYAFKTERNFAISCTTAILTTVFSLVLIPRVPFEYCYFGRVIPLAAVSGVFGVASCVFVFYKGRQFYNKEYWKFCLPIALPFVVHCLSDLLLGHSDMLMLKQMGNDTMVGLYSLAYNFSNILYMVWTSLNGMWGLFYYEYLRINDIDGLKKTARNYTELFTAIACGFILLQSEVFRIYAAEEFWSGAVLVPLFTLSNYSIFLSSICVNYEAFHHKTGIMATGTILACVLNLVLNYFLIPLWGIVGAAIATVLSHMAQATYHQIMVRRIGNGMVFPIAMKMLLSRIVVFAAVTVFAVLTPNLWWIRWPLGAVFGVWELYRIIKRKMIM